MLIYQQSVGMLSRHFCHGKQETQECDGYDTNSATECDMKTDVITFKKHNKQQRYQRGVLQSEMGLVS